MKPNRDSNELAARVGLAANTPVPLPPRLGEESAQPNGGSVEAEPEPSVVTRKTKTKARAAKENGEETQMVMFRPRKALLQKYVEAAAERSCAKGKMVSAQQVMLEVLERGL